MPNNTLVIVPNWIPVVLLAKTPPELTTLVPPTPVVPPAPVVPRFVAPPVLPPIVTEAPPVVVPPPATPRFFAPPQRPRKQDRN